MNRKNFECVITQLYKTGGINVTLDDDNLVSLQHRLDSFIDGLSSKDDYCTGAFIGDIIDTKHNKVIVKGWQIKI